MLADSLETKAFDIKKTNLFCASGYAPGATPVDGATQLRDYKIKETKRSCGAGTNENQPCTADSDCPGGECVKTPKHERQPTLVVRNALGTLVVATKKPAGLMAATAIAFPAPAPTPGPTNVDTYKCYGVKLVKKVCAGDPATTCRSALDCGIAGLDGPCLTRFPKGIATSLRDNVLAIGDRALQLKKPTRLCLATAVDGAPPQHPDAHFLCYAVKALKKACAQASGIPGQPCRKNEDCGDYLDLGHCVAQTKTGRLTGVHATNFLGRERVDLKKEKEVCLPSVVL